MNIMHASQLSNAELTREVSRLARCEREATVALIVHLAEFDARRLYEGAGLPSLFQYCRAVLHLSEDAVYNRIETARAVRRYPAIADMLLAGTLSPTTVRMLARHLTRENHTELLARACGKGKQELEVLLARHSPQPDVPATIRKLVAPPLVSQPNLPGPATPVSNEGAADAQACASVAPAASSGPLVLAAAPAGPRSAVRPLALGRYEIRFTANTELCEKLKLAQDLLGHAIPSGDLAQVFDRALTLLVEDLTRKKFAATPRPGPSRHRREESRHIPAAVRRAVWIRDGGRCAFVAASGRRCGARRFIEFHHLHPHGAGGPPTVENIHLRCRAHNGHEVELFYGPGKRYRGGAVAREPRAKYRVASSKSKSFRNELDRRPGTGRGISGQGREGLWSASRKTPLPTERGIHTGGEPIRVDT